MHDLYKSVVQSHLDYYIQHNPSQVQRDIAEPDRVQNKVTKMITAWKESSRETGIACFKKTVVKKEYIKTNCTEVGSSLPHRNNRSVTEIKGGIFKTDQKEMLSLTTA